MWTVSSSKTCPRPPAPPVPTLRAPGTAGYDLARANPLLTQSLVSSFITRLSGAPADKADFAIIRADSPSESEHPGYIFGQRQGEGRLDFRDSDPAYAAILKASAHVPVILTVKLDRPAILTNVKDKTAALIANFGIDDTALLEVLSGKARPEGHLAASAYATSGA
jgi:hypothetical protein